MDTNDTNIIIGIGIANAIGFGKHKIYPIEELDILCFDDESEILLDDESEINVK